MNNKSVSFDPEVINETKHNPIVQEIADVICHRTGSVNRHLFQVEIAYFLTLIPSMLRAKIHSPERGIIPINCYSIAIAHSGFGKGHSIEILEGIVEKFRKKFMRDIFFPEAEDHLFSLATSIAAKKNTQENEEYKVLKEEFAKQGSFPFCFDSGTSPALKQLRYKLLLANCASINFQMDEIGSNLLNNTEMLNVFLELYDLGKVKTKIIKNTNEQRREISIKGSTPANMLMFGTPYRLFDGSKTEQEFHSFLNTGYARRCLFAVSQISKSMKNVPVEKQYDYLVEKNKNFKVNTLSAKFEKLADKQFLHKIITVPRDTGINLLSYRLYCEDKASKMPDHEELRKIELSHRYFKALKLAGCYAFLDEVDEITPDHLNQAIKMTEESGISFDKILARQRNFIRLANYLSDSSDELTHADLVEDLPYYPQSQTARKEMMELAMAWGVSNNILITKTTVQDIDFFKGEKLKETDISRLKLSWSFDPVEDFQDENQPFYKLEKLLEKSDIHWSNHFYKNGTRSDFTTIPGFSFVVIETDIDEDIPSDVIQKLLSKYKFVSSISKNSLKGKEQFRILIPCSHELKLSKADYALFIKSLMLWLPFKANSVSSQRSKRWVNLPGSKIFVNNSENTEILNILPFIPKTKGNIEFIKSIKEKGNLNHLDRWFLSLAEETNKADAFKEYISILLKMNFQTKEIKEKVSHLNTFCEVPLRKGELNELVFKHFNHKQENKRIIENKNG